MAGRQGAATLKRYFGLLPGQTLADFAKETQKLSDVEFGQLKDGIESGSLTY